MLGVTRSCTARDPSRNSNDRWWTGAPRSERALNRPWGPRVATVTVPAEQLALFNAPHPAIEQLRTLDVNTMTPLQALEHLARLIDEVRGDQSHA